MPFYLSEYIGAGTRQDWFRPRGSEQPGWSAIDLRPQCGRRDGGGLNACFLHLPVADPDPRLTPIGDDAADAAPTKVVNATLGTEIRPGTVRDLVVSALAHPPQHGWNRLMPSSRTLTKEIHLGGLLWHWMAPHWVSTSLEGLGRYCRWGCHAWLNDRWAPVIAGGAGASDNFNRANETPLAGNWTQQPGSTGSVNLASNAIAVASNGNQFYYWNAASFGADQDVSLTFVSGSAADGGPATRIRSTSSLHGYFVDYSALNPPLWKYVNGTSTNLGGTATNTSGPPHTFRLETSGSSLTAYFDAVNKGSATDTDITAAGAPGLFVLDSVDTWDDWSATEAFDVRLFPPMQFPPQRPMRRAVKVVPYGSRSGVKTT